MTWNFFKAGPWQSSSLRARSLACRSLPRRRTQRCRTEHGRHPENPRAVAFVRSPAALLANPLYRFSAKMVTITDGDTVDVVALSSLIYSIRLAGIDAPEHDQAFGTESTQYLSSPGFG
jgi:endonuclease YncB( thermonuclease family)